MDAREPLALRLDDVGACSKRYEVYSHYAWGRGPFTVSANWLFLKYLPGLKGWGPYRELDAEEWQAIVALLEVYGAKLTVAITAAWAESEGNVVPFPVKFPKQAAVLKAGVARGVIEIANHGLTHCVLQGNAFRPRWFSSNRPFHREFLAWLPTEVHAKHLAQSQQILEEYFGVRVVTFVPPGNVFTEDTLKAAAAYGLRYVSCQTEPMHTVGLMILGNQDTFAFHDRDIVFQGVAWLERTLQAFHGRHLCTIGELAAGLLQGAQWPR